jgi:hypothetical protein
MRGVQERSFMRLFVIAGMPPFLQASARENVSQTISHRS